MPKRIPLAVLIPLFLLLPLKGAAASSTIEGTVRDSLTGAALPGANVMLVRTSLGASTDINGKYTIRNVPPGAYVLRVTYVGYRNMEISLQLGDGETQKHDFRLVAMAVEGEEVVVTAQASGQNEAINQQLSSMQITNVVSSARIQELPDANAAESVGRLPGVSILRSGGEGMQVVIRGLQPKYNAITVDGVRMASSSPGDRSVDLSMISPYMLDGIEVYKAVAPDQDADVLGGTVNFKMREAKGGREGLGAELFAQGGYTGLSNAYSKYQNYKVSGSVEGRFLDDRLGAFGQADFERRNLSSNEFGATYDHLARSMVDYTTTGLNLNDIPRDRQRGNGSLVFDYKLEDGSIGFTNFFSSGVTEAKNRGEFYNIQSNLHNYTLAYSKSTLNIVTNALSFEDQLPIFRVYAKASHTFSETKNPNNWTVGFQQADQGLGQFLNKANLNPQAIPPVASIDPNSTYLGSLVNNQSYAKEQAWTASLDLETPLNFSDVVTSMVKFGGKYRYQTRSYDYSQYTGQGLGLISAQTVDNLIANHFPSLGPYANTTSIPMAPFLDPNFSYGKFLDGDYTMALPINYDMASEMVRYINSQAAYLASRSDIAYFFDNFNSTTNNYSGHEDQTAFYAMATINIGQELIIIPGIRYQDLKTTYTAPRGLQTTSSGTGGPYFHYDTTMTADHGYWFPDVTVRYKPLPWFDARLSYTNTVAYPDYNSITPRNDVSTFSSIVWNNYNLLPSRAKNYDAYFSFYDNSIGLFTAGGFLKQIDKLIYPWTFYVSGDAALPYFPPYLGATAPTGVYSVTTYVNNPYRVDSWGLELDWQTHFWYLPRPFDGLVLNVNYTHVFSKAKYPYTDAQRVGRQVVYVDTSFSDRLLYQPNNILNLAVGYDYRGFSVRLSLLYQDDIFTGPNFWPQLRTKTSAYRRWDLAAKQDLPWFGLQLYGDINNLNGASDISVINAPTGVPRSEQQYGMSGDLGIRWRL